MDLTRVRMGSRVPYPPPPRLPATPRRGSREPSRDPAAGRERPPGAPIAPAVRRPGRDRRGWDNQRMTEGIVQVDARRAYVRRGDTTPTALPLQARSAPHRGARAALADRRWS